MATRAAQVFHRLGGGSKGGRPLGVHYTIHILHHHDGVVDHDADGEDQAERVSILSEKPNMSITPNVPIRRSAPAMTGMRVARQF